MSQQTHDAKRISDKSDREVEAIQAYADDNNMSIIKAGNLWVKSGEAAKWNDNYHRDINPGM